LGKNPDKRRKNTKKFKEKTTSSKRKKRLVANECQEKRIPKGNLKKCKLQKTIGSHQEMVS